MADDRNPQPSLDDDVAEFAVLLTETLVSLKSAGPPQTEIADAFERAGLGKRHAPALLAVATAGPTSVTDLAGRLGLQLSSTSTIVGQLSDAGLVQRAEDPQDRRRTIVQLDPRHREAVDAWLQATMQPLRETLEALSPTARKHFMQGWRLLHQHAVSASAAGDDAALDC